MSYWSGKNVMVTGGGGFLGSHVVARLRLLDCKGITVVRSRDFDLTCESEVRQLFEQEPPDVLLHLAGHVGGIGANKARPADFYYKNILMNTFTIEYARIVGVEKIVAAGAGCGYPELSPLPLAESSYWEGFPQQESTYSLAKRMLHVQSIAYWNQHQLPIIVAIPGNIYGPHDNFDLENSHVVPALVRKFVEAELEAAERIEVWGSGAPTRDFVYAGDVAEGILKAAEVYDRPRILNLASGRETSIREVVDTLRELTGFAGEIAWKADRPDGQSRRVFDVSRAEDELTWHAVTPLAKGLELTLDWYRANQTLARNQEGASPRLALVP